MEYEDWINGHSDYDPSIHPGYWDAESVYHWDESEDDIPF